MFFLILFCSSSQRKILLESIIFLSFNETFMRTVSTGVCDQMPDDYTAHNLHNLAVSLLNELDQTANSIQEVSELNQTANSIPEVSDLNRLPTLYKR